MKRNKSTYVNNIYGVWYHLIPLSLYDSMYNCCGGCAFLPRSKAISCNNSRVCAIGRIFNNGGVWKEIGKK